MRVAVLGGTGFIGPLVVAALVESGHDVIVIHRGVTEQAALANVPHLHAARHELAAIRDQLKRFGPDVAIDMRPMTELDARSFVEGFSGVASRAVVVSSSDVYRAYGRLGETEPGPPDPVPLDEDAPLRERLFADRDAKPHDKAPDLENYDKQLVERVVLSAPQLSVTVLRLGMIHGPRSYRHWPLVKRMLDGRPAVILSDRFARWTASLGFSGNIAHAIALAAERSGTARVFNVSEPQGITMRDLCTALRRATKWDGEIVTMANDELPEALRSSATFAQDFVLDTSRIRSELGYEELTPFPEGLQKTVDWMRLNPPGPNDPMGQLTLDYDDEDHALRGRIR